METCSIYFKHVDSCSL